MSSCNDENVDPAGTGNTETIHDGKIAAKKFKLARMKQNYYATRVQACARGMLTRKLLNSQDNIDLFHNGTETSVKDVLQEIEEQDELAAADENPDYGYATGNREEDEENRQMTGN